MLRQKDIIKHLMPPPHLLHYLHAIFLESLGLTGSLTYSCFLHKQRFVVRGAVTYRERLTSSSWHPRKCTKREHVMEGFLTAKLHYALII